LLKKTTEVLGILVSNLKYETQYPVVSATAAKYRKADLVFVEEFRLKREVNLPVVLVIICVILWSKLCYETLK
jgi:hypothetical protein